MALYTVHCLTVSGIQTQVYGSVFHINRGNPLKMEVLVDSWPDFKTVISKPQSMEMVDDTDFYTNTYNIFTKDPENLRMILENSNLINWNQLLMLESLQQYLEPVIMSIAKSKGLKLEKQQCLLFVRDIHLGVYESSPKVNSEEKLAPPTRSQLAARDEQSEFQCSPVSDAEAELVNAFWINTGHEASLKFTRQRIQHLPSLCMRDPGGRPISWCIMDQNSEIRMAYTLPEYRCKGLFTRLLVRFTALLRLQWADFPFYLITAQQNVQAQRAASTAGLLKAPNEYVRWICRQQRRAT
ncbi:glycine N-acyltransferase-like [Pleurodeles waltl]|uniref:glycine N-acyltransferase-like n=1 Tax=Pleurodeles waltl TaxID=8319 RepID=UPI0037096205